MAQIPKSKIIENQYTNGTSTEGNLFLRFIQSKVPYVGFYNIVNGNRYYTGKTYSNTSKLLETYNNVSQSPASIAAAGSIPVTINTFNPLSLQQPNTVVRYFYKDLTSPKILIKEINKAAYNQLSGKQSMVYQVIFYDPLVQTLEEVNQQMPGLREFLIS